MPTLLAVAIGFSLSLTLLNLILVLRHRPRSPTTQLFALFMVAILAYLLLPLLQGTRWALLAATVQTAAPGVFWLLAASIFDDHFRWRPWQLALVKFTVFAPLLGYFSAASWWQAIFVTLPQALEFVLLAHTLWIVVRNWRTDLVEERRRLRLWFVGVNGTYLTALILSREVLFTGAPWLSFLEYLPPAALLLAISFVLLNFREGLLFPGDTSDAAALVPREDAEEAPPRKERPPAAEPVDSELVSRLLSFMEAERPWREMGLGIADLAGRLEVPEYRLRRAINGGLGYRNFNDFLNSYRIREAAERLTEPESVRLPVLTIAMDAGFRSLSAFNRAFKETHGVTPTAWRRGMAATPDS